MSYRRQLRHDLARHADDQVRQIMAGRFERATLAGATLTRLDDDGRPTGEVVHLDAGDARAMLDEADVDLD